MDYWQYLVVIGLIGCHRSQSLFVTNIDVPEIVDFRDNASLSCSYTMGTHKLNSVKWYKDGLEFFRYAPMMHPVFMRFPVEGVTLLGEKFSCNEVKCSIDLGQLTQKSSGAYQCEVSGDAPEFKLTSRTANMTVAALPQHEPFVHGVNPSYRLDDFVVANCSSDWSSPPASLSWYINNEKAPSDLLQPQQETTIFTNGFNLRLRSLEIRFYLDSQRFINSRGGLELKCVADINQIPALRREKFAYAHVLYKDDLTNQKLVNSKAEKLRVYSMTSHLVEAFALLTGIRLLLAGVLGDIVR